MEYSSISAYKERTREIRFKTSSGDEVSIDLYRKKSGEITQFKDENGTSGTFSFEQIEGYSFSIKGNGISEQDKIEIEEMMEKIQPLIEDFYNEELEIPYNQAVDKISAPFKYLESEDLQNYGKNQLVKAFDNTIQPDVTDEKLNVLEEFLKTILDKIDKAESKIYG
ncbi:MAG: hypothetical protein OIF32_04595 [Campylobacterales bacterium]|nr:hypothetical protein [Campylobacterales bacterium]